MCVVLTTNISQKRTILTLSSEISTSIYTLHDPDGELRYVGKTILSLDLRLRRHLSNARRGTRSYCAVWLRSLLVRGASPEIRLLQVVVGSGWVAAERYWIAHFREQGCRLVNLTSGGEGHPGHSPSTETRAKRSSSMMGFRHSNETRARLSEIARARTPRTGWRHSAEAKLKMSYAQKLVDQTVRLKAGCARRVVNPTIIVTTQEYQRPEAWRDAIGNANRGSKNGMAKLDEARVAEIKRLLLKGQVSQDRISQMFGVSRGLIGLIQRNRRWASVPWPQNNDDEELWV